MAMKMRSGSLGSRTIVRRHMPPAPGCQRGPEPCCRSPESSLQLLPPSVVLNNAASSAPAYTVSGSVSDGSRCQTRLNSHGCGVPSYPLMRAGDAVVDEFVADGLPRLAAIITSLHRLAEPVVRLRRVDAVRINRRAFQVVELPAAEKGTVDVPRLARAVRVENGSDFACADQYSSSVLHTAVRHHAGPDALELLCDGGTFRLRVDVRVAGAHHPKRQCVAAQ